MAKVTKTKEKQRQHNMSRIRSNNTSIEAVFRKALWNEGIRYQKNCKQLPGTPDIAIFKYQIAIFCDGEFWHGKDWETKKTKIQSNREYWIAKIEQNMNRDSVIDEQLRLMKWTVLRFWGKDIKSNLADCVEEVKEMILQIKLDSLASENNHLCDY